MYQNVRATEGVFSIKKHRCNNEIATMFFILIYVKSKPLTQKVSVEPRIF